MTSSYRTTCRDVNSFFCLIKNPLLCRSARPESSGRCARGTLWRRSVEVRASGAVGLRWQAVLAPQIVWNKSTRRAGARGGFGLACAREDPAQPHLAQGRLERVLDDGARLSGDITSIIRGAATPHQHSPCWLMQQDNLVHFHAPCLSGGYTVATRNRFVVPD